MKDYILTIVIGGQVISRHTHNGRNAVEAFEDAFGDGKIWLPSDTAAQVVATSPNGLSVMFEVQY